jgi:hypothetical protein
VYTEKWATDVSVDFYNSRIVGMCHHESLLYLYLLHGHEWGCRGLCVCTCGQADPKEVASHPIPDINVSLKRVTF